MEASSPPPLQFDVAAGPAQTTCGLCRLPLRDRYYTVDGQVACESCREALTDAHAQTAGAAGVLRAVAFGSLPGALGALAWWAVRRFLSLEIGLIAVGIGHFVGLAVRSASAGRGGRRYQVLAVALTYFWITANYVPDIVAGGWPTGADAAGLTVSDVAWMTLMVIGIALSAPFLDGVENVIGLAIIGFGLYQAWILNRGAQAAIAGPFELAPSLAPPPLPGA